MEREKLTLSIDKLGIGLLGKAWSADSLRGRLITGVTGTFGLQVISFGLSFVTGVLLARLLSVADYGTYTYALAWVGLLGVLANLGLDRLLVREIAAQKAQSAWGLMNGLLRSANRSVLLVSIGLILLAFGISWFMKERFDFNLLITFWVALLTLPLMALSRLRKAALQGLHQVVTGQLPEMLIRPLLLIALIVGANLLLKGKLNAPLAMGMNAVAVGVAFLVGTHLLLKTLPKSVSEKSLEYRKRAWIYSAFLMLLISGMQMINDQADILMLGAIKGVEAVGVYNVAKRGVQFILFGLIAVNVTLGPIIASLYARGEMKRLQRIVTLSARVVLLISLPFAAGLIIFGNWFLLIFGPEYTTGRAALAILGASQLFNAAMGSCGLLLIMTGYERDVAMGIGLSAVLNVILNAILIPQWGLEGAAVGTASTLIIWNSLFVVQVYRRLGIHSTAVGRISLRRER